MDHNIPDPLSFFSSSPPPTFSPTGLPSLPPLLQHVLIENLMGNEHCFCAAPLCLEFLLSPFAAYLNSPYPLTFASSTVFHLVNTAITKNSFLGFISPFQISIALMVSKMHLALIPCHILLLFMVVIIYLLSAHLDHGVSWGNRHAVFVFETSAPCSALMD